MKNCKVDLDYAAIVKEALREDIGTGDVTTDFFVPEDRCVSAVILSRQEMVACGLDIAAAAFSAFDKKVNFRKSCREGELVACGVELARLSGKARSLLTAERVAMNFLGMLSGIATLARAYVDKVKPYPVKIVDTRKTYPCLRKLQKYAVRVGGADNHRSSLDEMVLVKDNHLASYPVSEKPEYLRAAIARVRREFTAPAMKIEVEVETLSDFKMVLGLKPDIILLDNMHPRQIREAVRLRNASGRRPLLEVSGGVTLSNIRAYAAAGADIISVGALTHSVKSADISMEFLPWADNNKGK